MGPIRSDTLRKLIMAHKDTLLQTSTLVFII